MSEKLVKELKANKASSESAVNGDQIVDQVKNLLLNSHNEDLKLYETLGLDHQIKYEKELITESNRSKVAESIYSKPSFTGKEIKSLCIKYDLKLLPVHRYNGSIPPELARIIREFGEANSNVTISSGNFYMLAPSEQFKNVKHVPIKDDPILFYLADGHPGTQASESDVFTQVYNWGNDFSHMRIFRYLFSTVVKNSDDMKPKSVTISFLALYVLIMILGISTNSFIPSVICLAVSLICFWIASDSKVHKDTLWNVNED